MAEHEELVPAEGRVPERIRRRTDSVIESGQKAPKAIPIYGPTG